MHGVAANMAVKEFPSLDGRFANFFFESSF